MMVHLRVADNGCGIDAETLPRLFERGFSTRKGKRSGLGLHWAANVAAAMNGELRAESGGAGQGACFHLKLPLA